MAGLTRDCWLVTVSLLHAYIIFTELLYCSCMLDLVDVEVLEVGEDLRMVSFMQHESVILVKEA